MRVWDRLTPEVQQRFSQVNHFFGNLQCGGSITAAELALAETIAVRFAQKEAFSEIFSSFKKQTVTKLGRDLGLFLDPLGMIRCRGRLTHTQLPDSTTTPLLLPRQHPLTTLIIEQAHSRLFHPGVRHTLADIRQQYWIPKGRSVVKSVLNNCLKCRRHSGGHFTLPPFPPLPSVKSILASSRQSPRVDTRPPGRHSPPVYTRPQSTLASPWMTGRHSPLVYTRLLWSTLAPLKKRLPSKK